MKITFFLNKTRLQLYSINFHKNFWMKYLGFGKILTDTATEGYSFTPLHLFVYMGKSGKHRCTYLRIFKRWTGWRGEHWHSNYLNPPLFLLCLFLCSRNKSPARVLCMWGVYAGHKNIWFALWLLSLRGVRMMKMDELSLNSERSDMTASVPSSYHWSYKPSSAGKVFIVEIPVVRIGKISGRWHGEAHYDIPAWKNP